MESFSTTEPFRFDASSMAGGVPMTTAMEDPLVRQTRREIALLVREVARLARQQIPSQPFFQKLIESTAQAMAAAGGVVYCVGPEGCVPLVRTGTQTDLSLEANQVGCHAVLLSEVLAGAQPVVVPPTPQVTDPEIAANPTLLPVALVPLGPSDQDAATHLLELFLEPDGGPASQRGYLRFVAQMADLATDYLKQQQLRTHRRSSERWQRLSDGLPGLHRTFNVNRIADLVVDLAAETFSVDRVSLCRVTGRNVRLLAVSHVANIDRQTAAAQQIVAWTKQQQPLSGPAWFADAAEGQVADPSLTASAELGFQAITRCGQTDRYCLVAQHHAAVDWDEDARRDWRYLSEHAGTALEQADQVSRIPGVLALLRLMPRPLDRDWRTKRLVYAGVLALFLLGLAVIPVPVSVTSRCELTAANTQYLYAPSQGIVAEVYVDHGQQVSQGMPLVTIVDRTLEERLEVLAGQRAVLIERLAEVRMSITEQTLRKRDELTRLQAEQQVIEQQLSSLLRQQALLSQQVSRLTLRSDRDGVIDGWQLRRQLLDRPVVAGQVLFSVIQPEAGWQIEAFIPQNRLDLIPRPGSASAASSPVLAKLVLTAFSDQRFEARLEEIGPALTLLADEGPVARARFRVVADNLPPIQTNAPGKLAIDCGKQPLWCVATRDLRRTLQGWKGLYL